MFHAESGKWKEDTELTHVKQDRTDKGMHHQKRDESKQASKQTTDVVLMDLARRSFQIHIWICIFLKDTTYLSSCSPAMLMSLSRMNNSPTSILYYFTISLVNFTSQRIPPTRQSR